MILVSEVGDKTFLIAAILAMSQYAACRGGCRDWAGGGTHVLTRVGSRLRLGLPVCSPSSSPRLLIFSGALTALVVMTILSAALGWAVPALLPRAYVHYLSIVFFGGFAVKMLREWYVMDPAEGKEELEETEGELKEAVEDARPGASASDLEIGAAGKLGSSSLRRGLRGLRNLLYLVFTPIWMQTFSLTFVAEWGDRSQISTIAMAAASDPFGITFGAIIGHAICTGVAVIGGRLLAARISVKAGTPRALRVRMPCASSRPGPRVRARRFGSTQ